MSLDTPNHDTFTPATAEAAKDFLGEHVGKNVKVTIIYNPTGNASEKSIEGRLGSGTEAIEQICVERNEDPKPYLDGEKILGSGVHQPGNFTVFTVINGDPQIWPIFTGDWNKLKVKEIQVLN